MKVDGCEGSLVSGSVGGLMYMYEGGGVNIEYFVA